MRICEMCSKDYPDSHFPLLRNGKHGRFCIDCKPIDAWSETLQILEAVRFVETKQNETPCSACGLQNGVVFFKKNAEPCDLTKLAESGSSVWFIRRLLSNLKPLCSDCSATLVPVKHRMDLAETFKGKALREKNPKKKAQYWAMHFRWRGRTEQQSGRVV